jgi:hypothetical protein
VLAALARNAPTSRRVCRACELSRQATHDGFLLPDRHPVRCRPFERRAIPTRAERLSKPAPPTDTPPVKQQSRYGARGCAAEPHFGIALGRLGDVYSLRFPLAYARMLKAFSIANLHIFNWLPGFQPVCLGLRALEAQLWFATFAPVAVALAALVAARVHFRALAPAVPFVLNWTLLLFPSISSRGFRALAPCDCFPYADGSEVCFLREDYGVECSGPSVGDAPPSVRAPAWVAIIFWAAGVPLLYACLLSTPHLRGSLSTLTGDYRPEAAWWELVHVGEKLILVGFLSLFEPGQWSQIFVAALVALSALLLKMWVWPYRSATGDQPRELDTH